MSSHRQRRSSFSDERKEYRFNFSYEDRFDLDDEDAISNLSSPLYNVPPMLKFKDFMQAVSNWVIGMSCNSSKNHQWFSEEGCKCEVLLVKGGGWQKGRFRFRLEFIPDNPEAFLQKSSLEDKKPESPLEDLRSQLNPE